MSKRVTLEGTFELFNVPFIVQSVVNIYNDQPDTSVIFTVRVGDRTLGDVLRHLVNLAGPGYTLKLDSPWDVLDSINLQNLVFMVDVSGQRYGFKFDDIGLDLTFLRLDALEAWYQTGQEGKEKSVDIGVYGVFFGLDFTRKPITWDALKERPPQTPGAGEKVFQLDYLGLGQHVTLRNIEKLHTVGQVIDELTASYEELPDDITDPLQKLLTLTYDDSAAWLVGIKFSVLDTFDFSAIWNLPLLAGMNVGLRGERAKSLAGFEFEILYKKVAEDLGVYQIELKLPDVLRKFNVGAAAVSLPIINIDIYTDGGFLVDLGFPHNFNFSRSCSIEMIIMGIPVTGALGVYFGVLDGRAVPKIPQIQEGSISPAIVAGVGLRIGIGKSLQAGILQASLFIGIEGMLEGIVGFYTPVTPSEPKATFYRVAGIIRLSGHISGQINLAIIKAQVDVYVFVAVGAVFEAYKSTVLYLEAGVCLRLKVTIGFGIFSFNVSLSFSTTIREQIGIGEDQPTPWLLKDDSESKQQRLRHVGFRRLPTDKYVVDETFASLLGLESQVVGLQQRPATIDKQVELEIYFHPVATVGRKDYRPGIARPPNAEGEVFLVASLMGRISRIDDALSPMEEFAQAALLWGIAEVKDRERLVGGSLEDEQVTLSELSFLAHDLAADHPKIPINMDCVKGFLKEYIAIIPGKIDPQAPPRLTPLPMIPFFSLNAGQGAYAYTTNFETEPMCSVDYQKFVSEYFETVSENQSGDTHNNALSEELSLAGLIFVDSFRMILRSVVNQAIEELESFTYQATDQDLATIVEETGISPYSPATGVAILAKANQANKQFFAAGAPINLVATGVCLSNSEQATLAALANQFQLSTMQTARHISSQSILSTGETIKVRQGRYRIQLDDNRAKISSLFGVEWPAIEEMNPEVDWRPYPWPKPEDGEEANNPLVDQELPVGTEIDLPELDHIIAQDETMQGIADHYHAPLSGIVSANKNMPLVVGVMAWRNISLLIQEEESIASLAKRLGLDENEPSLLASIAHAPTLLRAGETLSVPAGSYTFVRGDSLASVAIKFQTTPTALREANPDVSLAPPPSTDMSAPYGLSINLPAITNYVVSNNETVAAIVDKFSLVNGLELLKLNWDVAGLLTPLSVFTAPPLRITATGEQSPVEICNSFGVEPSEFVVANQGVVAGQGSGVRFNQVIVPDCERIPLQQLLDFLGRETDSEDSSAFAKSVTALARFLLSGLRLPDPNHFNQEELLPIIESDMALYPLYGLSGQEWPAPVENIVGYEVLLTWNDTEDANEFRRITAPLGRFDAASANDEEPIIATLGKLDEQLITAFRNELSNASGLKPTIIAHTPYPMVERVPLEYPLDQPIDWATSVPPEFVDQEEQQSGERIVSLYPLQAPLRRVLPLATEVEQQVIVGVRHPDVDNPNGRSEPLQNIGWASQLTVNIHRINAGEGAFLKDTYEIFAHDAQGQADMLGLLRYVQNNREQIDVDFHVLYATDPVGDIADSLRSDNLGSEVAKTSVVLLKSNLSTDNHPIPTLELAPEELPEVLAAANLTEPDKFIEMIWQATTTNAGGFYLRYSIDEGLPEELFEADVAPILHILVFIRDKGKLNSISPRRFHNALVIAENLPTSVAALAVSARPHIVTVAGDNQHQSLDDIVALYPNLTAQVLAEINVSATDILEVGQPIYPQEPERYKVLDGDSLLTIALALKLSIADLASELGARRDILKVGSALSVSPLWSVPSNTVKQSSAGVRLIRNRPPEVPVGADKPLDPAGRIQWLFNLQQYQMLDKGNFDASTVGLPLVPRDRDYHEGEIQQHLWEYARLLEFSRWAKQETPDSLPGYQDPYAGLGGQGNIGIQSVDVFGNLLPVEGYVAEIEWQQLYRDKLVPLDRWPSTLLTYSVAKVLPNDSSPSVILKFQFDPAGYVSHAGESIDSIRHRAARDIEQWAKIYYQVCNGRLAMSLHSSLNPDHEEPISSYAYAGLARRIFEYLKVIESLKAVIAFQHPEELAVLADEYMVSMAELAVSMARQEGVLEVGRRVLIPITQLIMPGDSVQSIVDGFKEEEITPRELGDRNVDVPLSADLALEIDSQAYQTQVGDTLAELSSRFSRSPGDIAEQNAQVASFWQANDMVWLAAYDYEIKDGDTLADLALLANLPVEHFAWINRERPILRRDFAIAIPAHQEVPKQIGDYVRQADADISFRTFAEQWQVSQRSLVIANSDTFPLLIPGKTLHYHQGNDGVWIEVFDNDTLSTVTRRFREHLTLDSLSPVDIVQQNQDLKLIGKNSYLLIPPGYTTDHLSIPHDQTNIIGIQELSVSVIMTRPDNIDRYFIDAHQVGRVVCKVEPYLDGANHDDPAASLWRFAMQLESYIPELRVAQGNEVIESELLRLICDEKPEEMPTKLLVVQNDPARLGYTIDRGVYFFAPRPLTTDLWNGEGVPIYPYVPGQPLSDNEPVATKFVGVDLERWAKRFLSTFDLLLTPSYSVALQALSAENYTRLIAAKELLADAIVSRLGKILTEQHDWQADVAAAAETMRQQLLVSLAAAYRGGVVVQCNAKVNSPWTNADAPALYGQIKQAAYCLPEGATLDQLAAVFGGSSMMIAQLLYNMPDILDVGAIIPIADGIEIKLADTIGSIVKRAGVTLEELVAVSKDREDFLKSRAAIQLVSKKIVSQEDDSFISLLTYLAVDLLSRASYDKAVDYFATVNGMMTAVFIEGIELYANNGKKHKTKLSDSINSAARALSMDAVNFVKKFSVSTPLLRPGVEWKFVSSYPPSTISPTRLSLCHPDAAPDEQGSKLNFIYVTSAPDDTRNVKLQLEFQPQNLEYNIRDVSFTGQQVLGRNYHRSSWATFVTDPRDDEHGETDLIRKVSLGEIEIPIVNRQFPVPPAVVSQDTIPHIAMNSERIPSLNEIPIYHYQMEFTVHQAAQDQLEYYTEYNTQTTVLGSYNVDDPTQRLAGELAQFVAIEESLWDDLHKLRSIDPASVGGGGDEIVINAISVFTELAVKIAQSWSTWVPVSFGTPPNRVRIRQHQHPQGDSNITVCAAEKKFFNSLTQAELPQVSLIGQQMLTRTDNECMRHMSFAPPDPRPTALGGDRFRVTVDGLNVLEQQSAWGKVSVVRNNRLVEEVGTNPDFVLHINNVSAPQPAVPSIGYTGRLDVADGLGNLAERLAKFLKNFLHLGEPEGLSPQQLSLTLNFARSLVDDSTRLALDPSDPKTMFSPIATLPVVKVALQESDESVTPLDIGKAVQDYLMTWIKDRAEAHKGTWSFAFKLFSTSVIDPSQPPLLELADLRVRISDT